MRQPCRTPRTTISLLAVAAGLSAGCSRDPVTVPVEGQVTYHGAPLVGATVVFINSQDQTKASFGITGDDGRYQLHSFVPPNRELSGAWAANCKVLISKRERRNTSAALMQMARAAMGRLPGDPEDAGTAALPAESPSSAPTSAEGGSSSAQTADRSVAEAPDAAATSPAQTGGYPPGWEEAFGTSTAAAPVGGVPIDNAARQAFIERMSAQNNGKSLIPTVYGDWQRTPLQVTVEAQGTKPLVFDFDLHDEKASTDQ